MNLITAISRKYSLDEVSGLLRMTNGFSLLVYYLVVLTPQWDKLYSSSGYVKPQSFNFFPVSLLFYFWDADLFKQLLFGLTILLIFFYMTGFFGRISQLLLIPLHLSFHHANPLIIHEPQQLTNLLLIILLFLPIENAYYRKRGPKLFGFPDGTNPRETGNILLALKFYLGIYYLLAGIKKLPESSWLNGSAVSLLSSWPYLAREHFLSDLFQSPVMSPVLTYGALFFEMGFIFFSFTRKSYWIIPVGIGFHLGITFMLDVGLFFWAMIMWYPLLLNRTTCRTE